MVPKYYLIDKNGKITTTTDVERWSKEFFESNDRFLKRTELENGITISTCFAGINLNFTDDGPPLLFETMIFGGEDDCTGYRFERHECAINYHDKLVKKYRDL